MEKQTLHAHMLMHERRAKRDGYHFIVGVDEAGRGPLAGPVVAAAVLLQETQFQNRICDSKKITALQREKAFFEIFEKGFVGIGMICEKVIDEQNILRATFYAMNRAVVDLVSHLPATWQTQEGFQDKTCLLVDGNLFKTDLSYPYRTIIKGDNLSLSIAAASIVAKVFRDRILMIYDQIYPQYGFVRHKGYGTEEHRAAILQHGLSPIHRKTYVSPHEPV